MVPSYKKSSCKTTAKLLLKLLKFTVDKINRHLKSKTEYYKIVGDNLIGIELEEIK